MGGERGEGLGKEIRARQKRLRRNEKKLFDCTKKMPSIQVAFSGGFDFKYYSIDRSNNA